MKKVINEVEYEVLKDYGDTLEDLNLDEIVTDYYDDFDYIVGDWAYGKVRLKGFYDNDHKGVKEHNNINNVEKYLNDNCAYGCKHFILKKVIKTKQEN